MKFIDATTDDGPVHLEGWYRETGNPALLEDYMGNLRESFGAKVGCLLTQ